MLNPKNVTFNISQKDQWFITKETFEEALGGEEFIKKDPRLANMIWQTEFLLGNRIEIQDFIYIMHYPTLQASNYDKSTALPALSTHAKT